MIPPTANATCGCSFRVLLGAVPVVAAGDGVSRHTLSHTPEGLAEIRVPAFGQVGWVRWARGRVTSAPGPAPDAPDATITFTDRETTDAALLGQLDPNAAVGLGKVAIAGLVPLADGLSLVMDRVETYLKPAGAAATHLANRLSPSVARRGEFLPACSPLLKKLLHDV